jgi:phosphohistidine phosphatase
MPDAHRHLSAAGRTRALAIGERLAEAGVRFDRLLMSPLVRAVQTAELLARIVPTGDLVVLEALAPGGSPQAVIQRLGGGGTIALVGHAPNISDVGALLVGQPSFPPLRPAQVAAIDRGRAKFTLNPETLSMEPLLLPD